MNPKLPFTPSTRMADVIHRDYRLIPIISRFGIEFGFGNNTVKEVCEKHQLNYWFFLEIINSYHNPQYFPKEQLQNFNSGLIIHYLSNTHSYYLDSKVPEIQGCINEMEKKVAAENQKNIQLLNDFFKEYVNELDKHLENEEKQVFPYIFSLEEALKQGGASAALLERVKKESIEQYESDHSDLEEKLSDLKNLIIKYLPPVLCKELCQKLLTEIFRLENDIEDHTRIEEKVLVPKVKILEQQLIAASGNK